MPASITPLPQPRLSSPGSGLSARNPRSSPSIHSRYSGLEVAGVVTSPRPPPVSQMW